MTVSFEQLKEVFPEMSERAESRSKEVMEKVLAQVDEKTTPLELLGIMWKEINKEIGVYND